MRLLVVNFEMDDEAVVLAWQARVVRELARHCERVVVLSERVGQSALPVNVHREQIVSRSGVPLIGRRLARLWQAWRLCRAFDVQAVFLHMAHRYAYQFYPVFRALRLPVLLWYAHGTVSWHLRLAHYCVDRVISSTPEGFRLPSSKAYFIGQGIDTDLFTLRPAATRRDLITVSRISRRKRLDLLLAVMEHLRNDNLTLRIIGAPLTADDRRYETELRERAARLNLPVEFIGFVPLEIIPSCYDTAALHLNVSQTDSMDKTVLESLACGCPVLTSNPAFRSLLADYPDSIVQDERPQMIASQVRRLLASNIAPEHLRALILGHHDLHSYVRRVLDHLHALAAR